MSAPSTPSLPLFLLPRRTLINSATVEGRGLFTGSICSVTFIPAPPAAGTGIVIERADIEAPPLISATVESIAAPPAGVPARNTTLRVQRGNAVAEAITVEHALSALIGLGITDVTISLRGPELPIGDGSAALFTSALWSAGLRYTGEDVEPLILKREVTVTGAGGARITARPRERPGCSYTYELDFGAGGPIAAQSASFDSAPSGIDYIRDVAPARTFCTLAEADAMKKAGLFTHFSAKDLLVIGEDGPIENAYRFENEPARHKLLDLMGDLALVGRPIQADIVAEKSGHALNHLMARELVIASGRSRDHSR